MNSSHHLDQPLAPITSQKQIRTLVGTRILEQHNLALLKVQARLLRQEEVGTLHNVLEVGLALGIDERSHVGDVDRFRSATARHKQISLEAQMSTISEIGAIEDNLARYRSIRQ